MKMQWIWIVERGCVIERDSSGIATRLVASMRDISCDKTRSGIIG